MVWQRPFFSGVLFLLALFFTILYESFFSICDFNIYFIRGIAGYRIVWCIALYGIALYGVLNCIVYYDFVHYFVNISRLYLVLSLLR